MIHIPNDSDFSIHNIPFGIASNGGNPFVATRVGDHVINLFAWQQAGAFQGIVDDMTIFDQPVLNPFIALGKEVTTKVRHKIQTLLADESATIHQSFGAVIPVRDVEMHLPVSIGDYTDFYSSIEHATNVGMMFRDPANALLPNWK